MAQGGPLCDRDVHSAHHPGESVPSDQDRDLDPHSGAADESGFSSWMALLCSV